MPERSRMRQRSRRREAAIAHVLAAYDQCDRALALERDPVQFPRRYSERCDREIASLLAALLAFGNVETIRSKLGILFDRLQPSPGRAARDWSPDRLRHALTGFRHRTFRGEDIAALVTAAGTLMRRDGGLYVALERAFERHGSLRPALADFVAELRMLAFGPELTRSARHLLPDPSGPSACKRLALLTRWIARPDDGVDLGLANLPTRALIVPLDVHVHRVARALGFTRRATASWRAAEEVTNALREIDPQDPVRFDFAVCHVAIDEFRRRRSNRRHARLAGTWHPPRP